MLYTMKRIENIIKNKELALTLYHCLMDCSLSMLTEKQQEQILDVVHGDSAVMFHKKDENVIIVTLGNGEEIQNVDFISDILLIRKEKTSLIVSSGCGILEFTDDFELTNYTFYPGITINIDFLAIDIITHWQGHHLDETNRHLYYALFNKNEKNNKI